MAGVWDGGWWWWWWRRWWWWTNEEGKEKQCCFGQTVRKGGLMSSLTCNAVLGCIAQSFPSCQWRGPAQRLTTAKESSRSDGEKETVNVWEEKVSERVGECAAVPCAVSVSSLLLSFSSFYFFLFFLLTPFATAFFYNLCFSAITNISYYSVTFPSFPRFGPLILFPPSCWMK